jgi:hypothetical protein
MGEYALCPAVKQTLGREPGIGNKESGIAETLGMLISLKRGVPRVSIRDSRFPRLLQPG